MKISKVYTRTGDKGTTSLVGGVRVKKTNPRIEAYGTIDELISNIGLLIDYMKEGDERKFIVRIQHNLFVIGSYLATDQTKTELREFCMIDPTETEALEEAIDEALLNIPPLSGFILPGGCMAAAMAHICRTVCRRAERRILAVGEDAKVSPEILEYINRLSDYLFVLARKLNFVEGAREKLWKNNDK